MERVRSVGHGRCGLHREAGAIGIMIVSIVSRDGGAQQVFEKILNLELIGMLYTVAQLCD